MLRRCKLSVAESGQFGPGHWLPVLNCGIGDGLDEECDKFMVDISICVVKRLLISIMASSNEAMLASAKVMSRTAISES